MATGTALQPQKKSKHSHYLLAGVPILVASVLVQMPAASPVDFPAIHAKQDQLKITSLSAWGKPYTPPASAPVNPNVDLTATPLDQVRLMSGEVFFNRLARILVDNPRCIPFNEPKMQCFIAASHYFSLSLNEQTLGPDRGYETVGTHF